MERVKELREMVSSKIVEASTFIKGMSIHDDEVAFLGLSSREVALVQHLLNAGVKVKLWGPIQKNNLMYVLSIGPKGSSHSYY